MNKITFDILVGLVGLGALGMVIAIESATVALLCNIMQ